MKASLCPCGAKILNGDLFLLMRHKREESESFEGDKRHRKKPEAKNVGRWPTAH
jgi:hypothetical protein